MINSLNFGPIVPSSPHPDGPGGNPIVSNPATPSDFPKMLLALGIAGGGIWVLSTLFGDEQAKWVAILVLLAIVTYYETHGNKRFSSGIQDLFGGFK